MIFSSLMLSLLAGGKNEGLEQRPLKIMLHMGFGSLSHIKPLLEIGNVLRDRNHSVIYCAMNSNERYNKPYQFPFVSLGSDQTDASAMRAVLKKTFTSKNKVDTGALMGIFFAKILSSSYEDIYPRLSSVVELEQPDVLICDFFSPACRDVAEMKGVPLISGFQTTDGFGIMDSPFVTSNLDYGSITTDKMSFTERFQDKVISPLKAIYQFYPMVKSLNKVREKYGVPPSRMPFGDFSNTLGIANTFVGFEAASNAPPNIKMVGPIKSDSYAPLSSELNDFMDTHQRTMYIAFGSQVVLADFDIINLVTASLTALAEDHIDGIVWGLGKTLLEDFPETISVNGSLITSEYIFNNRHPHMRLLSWAPQTAILEHENTRLFISHGGLESSFESILSGTPIICMAFLGDQPRNARKLEDAGIGKYVNRISQTPETLTEDIKYMMQDSTGDIKVNVQRMRTIALMGSRRKQAGADAIEEYAYTSQACRPTQKHAYGEPSCEAKHLIPVDKSMSFFKANLLDVYFAAFLILSTSVSALLYSCYSLICYFKHRFYKDKASEAKSQ